MAVKNPYSAEHPVPPEYFAGRKDQIKEFRRFFDDTLAGNSKNLAVLGDWGIGKTSLLRMLRSNLFAFKERDKITLSDLKESYPRILDHLGKRLFESLYGNVSLNERKVIDGFVKSEKETLKNVEVSKSTGVKSVNRYLKSLSELRPPVLIKVERGKYRLFHPLFKGFLRGLT